MNRRARLYAVLWALIIALLLLFPMPPESDDLPMFLGVVMFPGVDKVAHGVLFFVMAYLLTGALDLGRGRLPAAFVLAVAYGAATEVAQGLFTDRSAEVGDFLADTAGAALGAVLVLVPRSRRAPARADDHEAIEDRARP